MTFNLDLDLDLGLTIMFAKLQAPVGLFPDNFTVGAAARPS